MKKISLTKKLEVIVDDDDYIKYSCYKWYARKRGNYVYAALNISRNGKFTTYLLHRLISGALYEYDIVDHINGNTLDCRKINLRKTTKGNNNKNKHRHWGNIPYKGVSFHKGINKFRAAVWSDNKFYHAGYYNTALEAALARDRYAIKHHAEFANLNFPNRITRNFVKLKITITKIFNNQQKENHQ